jgi:hypothetical protein
MPGIFLRKDEGELVPLRGEMYESEDQLQALLAKSPELLLGETEESDNRPSYLLVRREAGVPEAEGQTDRWFLDHIFLDREGVPTLVEVKRSTNTQVRREVVGQMLDYAANILAHWPPDRMRIEFEARCREAADEPVEKVGEISDSEYEEYWTRVRTNLAAKRLRLVFVADHIPTTLQTIVEFLNEQMSETEVLAIEVKQHKGEGLTVLTTRTIGKTSAAKRIKPEAVKREWDETSMLEELRRTGQNEAATVAEQLLRWAERHNLELQWPATRKVGGPYLIVTRSEGEPTKPFGLGTDGKLWLNLGEMRRLPPFDQDEALLEFIRRIAAAASVPVEDNVVDKAGKSFSLQKLLSPESYTDAVAALDWFLEQTATGDAAASGARHNH